MITRFRDMRDLLGHNALTSWWNWQSYGHELAMMLSLGTSDVVKLRYGNDLQTNASSNWASYHVAAKNMVA